MARPADVSEFIRTMSDKLCREANDALEADGRRVRLVYAPPAGFPVAELRTDEDGTPTVAVDTGERPFRVVRDDDRPPTSREAGRSLSVAEIERRFENQAVTDEKVAQYVDVRSKIKNLVKSLSCILPDSREASLAFTAIEEALMWSRKAIYAPPVEST